MFEIESICFDGVIPSARCEGHTRTMPTATSIWNSFLNYERCSCNCKLQFPGNNSYFRKDFQMLFAVKKGEIQTPNRALGQI